MHILEKVLSIEKLNLTWNKQINKLGPLPRVFQVVLRGRRDGNLPEGFFYWLVGIWQGVILTTRTFFKPKTTFCKY